MAHTSSQKTLSVPSLHLDAKHPRLCDVAQSGVSKHFTMKACLATAVLLVALLAPSVSAQYIYVANTGEDTVSKIDINTNAEVARYATWFTANPNHVTTPHGILAGPAPLAYYRTRREICSC